MSECDLFLSPIGREQFFAQFFDRAHFVIRSQLDDFSPVTAQDIRDAVFNPDIPHGAIDLSRHGVLIHRDKFNRGGLVDPSLLRAFYGDGCTIIFRSAGRWLPNLKAHCHALSQ